MEIFLSYLLGIVTMFLLLWVFSKAHKDDEEKAEMERFNKIIEKNKKKGCMNE